MLTASLYQALIWIIWNSKTAFVGLFLIFQVWKVFKIKQFLETNWGYIYRSIKSNSTVYLWQIPLLNSWHFPMLEEFTTPKITQHFLLSIQFSFSKSVGPQKVTVTLHPCGVCLHNSSFSSLSLLWFRPSWFPTSIMEVTS